jgi:hypothetical protein
MPPARRLRRLGGALAGALLALTLLATPSFAGVVNQGLSRSANPLAGVRHGTYFEPRQDGPSIAYRQALDAGRLSDAALLRQMVDQPRFRWFGAWIPTYDRGTKWGAERSAREYIRAVTGGNPDVAAQMAVFRLEPFEREACRRLPTRAEQADYRAWIDAFARGIGGSRVALVLQPDMPFTLCLPGRSKIGFQLIDYAARRFTSLPRTTVYIDAGASDWLSVGQAAYMLRQSGVRRVRGFALSLTHYDSARAQIAYGQRLVDALARQGIRGRRFVVNTAQNGHAFTFQRETRAFKEAPVCRVKRQRSACVTLGIKPTTSPPAFVSRSAARLVDGMLWTGRPWLNNETPRSYDELVSLVRTSPYF